MCTPVVWGKGIAVCRPITSVCLAGSISFLGLRRTNGVREEFVGRDVQSWAYSGIGACEGQPAQGRADEGRAADALGARNHRS